MGPAGRVKVCRLCAKQADPADPDALTWACDLGHDGPQWTCATCARRHLRDIEAKLPDEWWPQDT